MELSTGVLRGKVHVRFKIEEIIVGVRVIKLEKGIRVREERFGIGSDDTVGIAEVGVTKSVGRVRT